MYDLVIIGGGFYGCMIALHYSKILKKILIIEKEADLLLKASSNNQARVHNGYHYPRNYLTALSSHKNYARFITDFKKAIVDNFDMYYAIAYGSKTSVKDFTELYNAIGAPLEVASPKIKKLFNPELIKQVFKVEEKVFNADILRDLLKARLAKAGVKIKYNTQFHKVKTKRIISCTYSETNNLLRSFNLPEISLKHELTNMPIVEVPKEFKDIGITIMDGDYFSLMPFPRLGLHTIHHVKYTPKVNSYDSIAQDVVRFIPKLSGIKYRGSVQEIKTVLPKNEIDDGRPILFKKDYAPNLDVILGGKLDNIYDILDKISDSEDKNLNIVT